MFSRGRFPLPNLGQAGALPPFSVTSLPIETTVGRLPALRAEPRLGGTASSEAWRTGGTLGA